MHGTKKIDFASRINPELIQSLDGMIISFGLVDVIWHIEKQAIKQNKSVAEIIDELVTSYIKNILSIKKAFPHYFNPIIIIAVTPPPIIDRITVTTALNDSISYHAKQNNIPFWDPYISCRDSNGLLLSQYDQGDCCHFAVKNNQIIVDSLYCFLENLS